MDNSDNNMYSLLGQKTLGLEQGKELCAWIGEKMNINEIGTFASNLPAPFSINKLVTKKIILFPGSFNPWHEGHRECVVKCTSGPIVIIPDQNPWKNVKENNPWAEVGLLADEIKSLDRNDVMIYPGFLSLDKKNPTYTWLPKINVEQKWLLMGDDLFLGLHRWLEAKTVLDALTGIYICPRGANKVELEIQKETLCKMSDLKVEFLDHHDYEELSSTQIREQLSK